MTNWQELLSPSSGSKPKTRQATVSTSSSTPTTSQEELQLKVSNVKKVKANPALGFRVVPNAILPHKCIRGQLKKPKLMIVTEAPSLWEFRYNFAGCGDAGFELDRVLSESGLNTGNFREMFDSLQGILKSERQYWNEEAREVLDAEYDRGEVLFYHLNHQAITVEREGKSKVKEMTDEEYYQSLALFHQKVCEIQPEHLLILGAGPFERIMGKTNVVAYAGVTFDYQFPAYLTQCLKDGSQDPLLLGLSKVQYNCLVDVDLHPAYILQNARQVSSWNMRLKNLAMRCGERQSTVNIQSKIFTEFAETEAFLLRWIEDITLTGLSYDFETLSLFPCAHTKSIIVTINLARDDETDETGSCNRGYAVPVWHKDVEWSVEQRLRISELIGKLLLKPRELSYGHNLLYDNLVARRDPHLGLGRNRIVGKRYDSMLFAYVVDETGSQGLKDLCNLHTDMKNYDAKLEEYKKANPNYGNYGNIPLQLLGEYGVYDAVANIRLSKALQKLLKAETREGAQLWNVATELMPVQAQALEDLPFWGQKLDREFIFKTSVSHQKVIDDATKALLETEEMKTFIEMRCIERAAEYAKTELEKPMNCTKVWMQLHPVSNRSEITNKFKAVKKELEAKNYILSSEGWMTQLNTDQPHDEAKMVQEVYLHLAVTQYEIDTGQKVNPKTNALEPYTPNFNTNGAGELGRYFYEHLGLPVDFKTETGAPSLNEDALDRLLDLTPSAKSFKSYKDVVKENGTYILPLIEAFNNIEAGGEVNYGMSPDHIAHYEIYLGRTVTGRTSAQLVQLLPRTGAPKKFFTSRFKDGVILQYDLSQVELRVFAAVSGDGPMIESYRKGEDLHLKTCIDVFGEKFTGCKDKKLKKEYRVGAKKTNFGMIFGTGAHGLMVQIKKDGVELLNIGGYNVDEVYDYICETFRLDRKNFRHYARIEAEVDKVREEVAAGILEGFFKMHPRALEWVDEVHVFAMEHGYYYTPFGRIRRLPDAMNSNNQQFQSAALRQAQNFPIQSAASDLTVVALAAIEAEIYERKLRSVPILAVHDMLSCDCPIDEAVQVASIMKYWMDNPKEAFKKMNLPFDLDWLCVPIDSDGELGPSWGECWPIKEGRLKMADADEGAPETIWIDIPDLWKYKEELLKKEA